MADDYERGGNSRSRQNRKDDGRGCLKDNRITEGHCTRKKKNKAVTPLGPLAWTKKKNEKKQQKGKRETRRFSHKKSIRRRAQKGMKSAAQDSQAIIQSEGGGGGQAISEKVGFRTPL